VDSWALFAGFLGVDLGGVVGNEVFFSLEASFFYFTALFDPLHCQSVFNRNSGISTNVILIRRLIIQQIIVNFGTSEHLLRVLLLLHHLQRLQPVFPLLLPLVQVRHLPVDLPARAIDLRRACEPAVVLHLLLPDRLVEHQLLLPQEQLLSLPCRLCLQMFCDLLGAF